MKKSLKRQLTLSHLMLSIFSILLIIILTNYILERQFRDYIINNINNKTIEILNSVKEEYKDGKWDVKSIESIGVSALENGMILKLVDNQGRVIWDAHLHNSGQCQNILDHYSKIMMKRYPNFNGGYKEEIKKIYSEDQFIATLYIGYYGPYYYTDNDIMFLNTLNGVSIVVSILAILFALLFGSLISKSIATPIMKVSDSTNLLSRGEFKSLDYKSEILEIDELINAINLLSKKLDEQEKLRKRLTQDISHELRTPITTIKSHVEAMIDGIWQPTEDRLRSCLEEIERLNKLIGDIKLLAEYEIEERIEKHELNLRDLIKSITLNFEKSLLDKRLVLETHLEDVFLYADKDKITQVIINLLSNAIKYSREGGKIYIELKGTSEGVFIRIKDDGIGIPKKDLPYIFERFYRVDQSRNKKTGGAGIGLSIVKRIINMHNGEISVKSELNKGTEFIIKLPYK
ncbi:MULTISPECIES: sensor histidine kinase [Caloramator]|uniref:histidine kinase n=1 Tax=Caloramator australicus RC3 TaxID=857293 RepID=I7K644_9CLOT|nr:MULTISPECIES: ATP-binding protein [Caloramator]MDO6353928.1 ATP-binding protein [Caloramator sp. CAR-1]CCJ33029.1 two-component sensor histidine kinase [Caloramator australicus RC3]